MEWPWHYWRADWRGAVPERICLRLLWVQTKDLGAVSFCQQLCASSQPRVQIKRSLASDLKSFVYLPFTSKDFAHALYSYTATQKKSAICSQQRGFTYCSILDHLESSSCEWFCSGASYYKFPTLSKFLKNKTTKQHPKTGLWLHWA